MATFCLIIFEVLKVNFLIYIQLYLFIYFIILNQVIEIKNEKFCLNLIFLSSFLKRLQCWEQN